MSSRDESAGRTFPPRIAGARFHFVGIKGTGMAGLAELFGWFGGQVAGSDTVEIFYTDAILKRLGIPYYEGFDARRLRREDIDLVVHSAAYDPAVHPELKRARELGIPLASYPEALGWLSSMLPSGGVAGVHGKTTTTAMAGTIAGELGLPAAVLAGSAAANFGDRSTLTRGKELFIAETCEYRRHFLNFHPGWILLTSVEEDHLDYFSGLADIEDAFAEYCRLLPEDGTLIYCADDAGARRAAERLAAARPGVRRAAYGRAAAGAYRIVEERELAGRSEFKLAGLRQVFELRVPGGHNVTNAAGAVALVESMSESLFPGRYSQAFPEAAARGLAAFRGSRRRSELIGEARGVLFLDDYAHHPTAIRTTLAGLRRFYPDRRLVLDFMSHTYSRTKALFDDFAGAFEGAELVVLHKIYASAREKNELGVSGRGLYEAVRARHAAARYFEEVMDALEWAAGELRPGDLFVTMGAGDNWKLGRALYERFKAGAGEATP